MKISYKAANAGFAYSHIMVNSQVIFIFIVFVPFVANIVSGVFLAILLIAYDAGVLQILLYFPCPALQHRHRIGSAFHRASRIRSSFVPTRRVACVLSHIAIARVYCALARTQQPREDSRS